ncbi:MULTISPECIES: glycoside hydrolase family 38 C-terminal domain-containing protein [Clostridium]|uniref:glycoside hydrolase family 38 N-terminal domain-containing protein n=1 Tax=Clostridium TaxID=1485 RepID=UPI0018AA3BBB|nr:MULTISPECIES: glycoside hydrolase family 38 C-terminal domain-containing protein [Clostridium]MDB1968971.1 glycoside hydrolase family 38 C-terminal domain-containing protein [Clostridium tertium]MDU1277473.1 glycoside hydrolase family 38 C-terminal domain-containing protein [Clostridium sp.]MDU3548894.1 glycoside hydrolase family 38 C-terminal domain-containing protein [Clostridium sp.]MDU4736618.1 glycoside hydrolase family 38 C-terminal domain-containing protein [Clostridium sp.]MDU708700
MKKIHVYPHTHWDYEWYFTSNESIIQLIYHMDEVMEALENGELETYLLDGQLSILEEYIKFIPSNFERVKNLVESGKLLIGPWYTQTDELIIDGESIVRNLFYGIKSASKYGDYLKIGYLPDSFGQTKDLPKILNGFDINRSIFWRGVANDVCPNREFIWKGEDDSSLLVYNIKNGYFYGGNLIYSNDVEKLEKTILDGSQTENILLPVGGDQRYVDFNLKERIAYYNERSKNNFDYVESDCNKFFDELEKSKNLIEVQGEFVNPSNSKIHRSIYSSRYDHKYLNDKVERKLIYHLEPLMVIAQNLGIDPKIEMIEEIWKKLLMNHAHDSACGCNSDKTNRSILARLIEADQLSYSACDYIIRKISESLNCSEEDNIILFNTLPHNREEVSKIIVTTKTKNFIIKDKDGNIIEHQLLERKREYAGSIKKDESQYDDSLYYYVSKVAIKCSLEPLSIEVLKVIQLEEEINIKEKASSNFIEDNFYKVEVVDGKINITDKISNRELKDCLYIEESGDDGDTYDYSPPEEQYDFRYNLDFKNAKVDINNGKLYKEIKISGEFKVPMNLKYREENIRNTEIPYELILTLSNKEIVECNLEIDNKACDHRMRAVLRTDINSKESISDTSFGTIRRDNVPAHINDWRELGWKEEPSPIYPMLHFVGIEEENKSVFMLAKGIKEYEVLENSNIALTLFRGVGFLGKPDLIRRPGIASGNEFRYIETPDSQLKEKLKFKFAITINNEVNITKINKIWKNYSITIPNYQIQEINRFTNTLKYFVMHPLKDKLEEVKDIVDCNDLNDIVVTSIIPVDKNSFTVRFVNYTDKVIDGGNIKVSKGKSYEWVNMNNKEISNKENIDSSINIGKFKSGEIKTLKINI